MRRKKVLKMNRTDIFVNYMLPDITKMKILLVTMP